jgi:alpha-mannosidase/mannosylglycerate hydrolase
VPLAAAPDRTALCDLGQRLAAGLRAAQLRAADVRLARASAATEGLPAVDLPAEGGYLAGAGDAVVPSARQIEGALEVRFFNPTTAPSVVNLGPPHRRPARRGWRSARPVDFESRPTARPWRPTPTAVSP